MLYYFAYGSNMNPSRMTERGVEYSAKFAGKMDGWILAFNKTASGKVGIGYANIIPKKQSSVEGVIYQTDDTSIEKLDVFEGFPKHYQRKTMPVKSVEGVFDCVVYVANAEKTQDGLLPEKDYVEHLLKGKEFLSEDYFKSLQNVQVK